MRRPRTVLITGAPGSGKSTLGHELARAVRMPFIARDEIRGGLFFTAGAWGDELDRFPSGAEAVDVFLDSVGGLLTNGVSCIVEYVVRRNRPHDFERITALGDCVVVMLRCDDPMARVRERNTNDRFVANTAVLDAVGVASVDEHTDAVVERMAEVRAEMRTTFPVPVLEVDTTAGYDPTLDDIVAFITTT